MRCEKMPHLVEGYRDTARTWTHLRIWYMLTFRFADARDAAKQARIARGMADQGEREGFWRCVEGDDG